MSTIRREGLDFSAEFTMTPNRWIRDGRLTLKAAALLMLLLSHRPGWVTSVRQIAADRLEGREAIMAGIAELEKYGYLKRERVRDEKGQLTTSVWTILDPDASSPQGPVSGNPTLGSKTEKPRSEPVSGFPTPADPDTGNPTTKKTKIKKTKPEENQGNGAPPATDAQLDWLRDLHLHGGGRSPDEVDAWLNTLTVGEADLEIKDALRGLPRGRDYRGDPDNEWLSWKGRDVALARMLPGRKAPEPRPAPEAQPALF